MGVAFLQLPGECAKRLIHLRPERLRQGSHVLRGAFEHLAGPLGSESRL